MRGLPSNFVVQTSSCKKWSDSIVEGLDYDGLSGPTTGCRSLRPITSMAGAPMCPSDNSILGTM